MTLNRLVIKFLIINHGFDCGLIVKIFLSKKYSHGDHDVGSLVELWFKVLPDTPIIIYHHSKNLPAPYGHPIIKSRRYFSRALGKDHQSVKTHVVTLIIIIIIIIIIQGVIWIFKYNYIITLKFMFAITRHFHILKYYFALIKIPWYNSVISLKFSSGGAFSSYN